MGDVLILSEFFFNSFVIGYDINSQAWQMYVESQPVRFIDRELFPYLIHVASRVAKFLGSVLN